MPAKLTHGVRSLVARNFIRDRNIARECGRLERQLADSVMELRQHITNYEKARIQSAARHEAAYRQYAKWLSENEEALKLETKCDILAKMSAATEARDKAIGQLNINVDPKIIEAEAIYGPEVG